MAVKAKAEITVTIKDKIVDTTPTNNVFTNKTPKLAVVNASTQFFHIICLGKKVGTWNLYSSDDFNDEFNIQQNGNNTEIATKTKKI